MVSDETMRLELPLLQPGQAQKHVTVNEALMRLDGMVGLVLQSLSQVEPPPAVIDGQCWAVPVGGQGAWTGKAGRIAIGSNGGWSFVRPNTGMRAFVIDQGSVATHDGSFWINGALTLGSFGSGLLAGSAQAEVTLTSGPSFDTGLTIPAGAMVIGAVARVRADLTGSLSTWRLGTPGATNRFGQGLGKTSGSWARGILGSPTTYYSAENLIMTGEGGAFTGGRVRLSVHWWELRLPE